MIRRIYVPLDAHERQALVHLSELERRDPRQQAALLIRRELERLGLLEPAPTSQPEAANARQAF